MRHRCLLCMALAAQAAAWVPDVGGACSRTRKSPNAVVWLGQRRHSTYDATHANTLNASMASVAAHYKALRGTDFLVWHEGDLVEKRDADALHRAGANVRWCLLSAETGWGRRPDQVDLKQRERRWADGYLSMIRWYAVTCWDVLEALGYAWMMRFDDDSFLLSAVGYDWFDAMRSEGREYGFRALSRECDRDFGRFADGYREAQGLVAPVDDGTIFCERFPRHCVAGRPRRGRGPGKFAARPYCEGPGRLGFYNNWFVTRVGWWTSPEVSAFRRAFDDSGLIVTHRNNDLIFQTAAVRLLLPREKWRRFADFSYQHHTIRDGSVRWGGLETGYADPDAARLLNRYLARWHAGDAPGDPPRVATCDVQLAANDSKFRTVSYVPHGMTRWKVLAAPYCNKNGRAPIW